MPVTESEEYLEKLACKSFLSMWSYSNLAFGSPATGKCGKELCDLLVLFKNNVLLFSDKSCQYPDGPDPGLNWERWYKRSIRKSVDQLVGARKTLSKSSQGIFTDLQLREPFPLPLPAPGEARFFLIAVSHGSEAACRLEHNRSTLGIDTRVEGSEQRLSVGVRFEDEFVHVLDDSTLDIVLSRLDTIVDFITYLERKEQALSNDDFVIHGEENLLASYVLNYDDNGQRCIPTLRPDSGGEPIVIRDGTWNEYVSSDRWRHSEEENRISYNIDMLIEHFTDSFSNGQMIRGQSEPLTYHEAALRMLASESRLGRRAISTSLVSILKEQDTSTFWASTIPSLESPGVRYVFVTYPEPPAEVDLETRERSLDNYLAQHVLVARHNFPDSRTLIGIAIPNSDCAMTSHFIRILDAEDWTEHDHAEAAELQRQTGIFGGMEEERFLHIE